MMLAYLKDLFTAKGTGGVFTSLGVVAGVIGLGAMFVNVWFGDGAITQVDQTTLQDSLTKIVTEVTVIGALITGVIARIRAKRNLSGTALKS